jgi:hypothetical protein
VLAFELQLLSTLTGEKGGRKKREIAACVSPWNPKKKN